MHDSSQIIRMTGSDGVGAAVRCALGYLPTSTRVGARGGNRDAPARCQQIEPRCRRLMQLTTALVPILVIAFGAGACDQGAQSPKDRPVAHPPPGRLQPESAVPRPAPPKPAQDDVGDEQPVIAAILQHEGLRAFLHPEVEGRVPVVLSESNLVTAPLDLTMFGQPVRVVSPGAAQPLAPVIELTSLERSATGAVIAIRYAVEGVSGQARLSREGSKWVVTEMNLSEH